MQRSTTTGWRARPKVLLAHHAHLFREKTRKVFERRGFELTAAASAQAVHVLARSLDPDVVVLDTRLRDESGFLTCSKLKSAYPDCRVILVGRRLSQEERRFARFCGAENAVDELHGIDALVGQVLDVAASTR